MVAGLFFLPSMANINGENMGTVYLTLVSCVVVRDSPIKCQLLSPIGDIGTVEQGSNLLLAFIEP